MMNRLLPIILIILSIGLFWLYTLPTYNNQVVTARGQIQNYNNALAAAQKFDQKEAQLIAEKNAIAPSNLTRLESFLPDNVDNVQLILDINQLASRSGLALSDFAVSSTQSSSGSSAAGTPIQDAGGATSVGTVNSLTLSVDATGSYASFRTFLAAAEQSLRLLDVTQLSITQGGQSATSNQSNGSAYKITFQLYWLQ